MRIGTTFLASALLALAAPAMAQESGGLHISAAAGTGPHGLAQLLPQVRTLITAADVQGGMTAADRQAKNQDMITRLRGDPGFLSGFSFGQPLAASRQPQPVDSGFGFFGDHHHHHHHGGGGDQAIVNDQANVTNQAPLAQSNGAGTGHSRRAPIVINNQGPLAVTVGNDNVVQQQTASGSGPIALQQVSNSPGGALNSAGGGNTSRSAAIKR
jgi:hypothetical protein